MNQQLVLESSSSLLLHMRCLPGVSRAPSPQGQQFEKESQRGDCEAGPANTPAGSLITLSTLLLSQLLFQKHYSLTVPASQVTAELVLMGGSGQ